MSDKKSKQQDTNVKVFMQTEAYNQLNTTLQLQLNNNSQVFNLKLPQPSNLLEPRVFVKRSKTERDELKRLKYTFKLNPDKGRDEIVGALVNTPMPNWNIKFSERRKVI